MHRASKRLVCWQCSRTPPGYQCCCCCSTIRVWRATQIPDEVGPAASTLSRNAGLGRRRRSFFRIVHAGGAIHLHYTRRGSEGKAASSCPTAPSHAPSSHEYTSIANPSTSLLSKRTPRATNVTRLLGSQSVRRTRTHPRHRTSPAQGRPSHASGLSAGGSLLTLLRQSRWILALLLHTITPYGSGSLPDSNQPPTASHTAIHTALSRCCHALRALSRTRAVSRGWRPCHLALLLLSGQGDSLTHVPQEASGNYLAGAWSWGLVGERAERATSSTMGTRCRSPPMTITDRPAARCAVCWWRHFRSIRKRLATLV